ncbi:MAG: hypothetical protein LBU12_02730 [Deltaproteobacteria bacterium]|nr:hypothetical protein [Deltaproteobacteria bacterium]
MDRLVAELGQGKNAVCILSRPLLEGSFLDKLRDRLHVRGLTDFRRLRPDRRSADLADLVRRGWNWEDECFEPSPAEDGLKALRAAFDGHRGWLSFAALVELDELSSEVQARLADDLRRWAKFPGRRQGREPSGLVFLCPVSPLFPAVPADEGLGVHQWWGQADLVDHQWAFKRSAAGRFDSGRPAEDLTDRWWLQALCRALCLDDFELMGDFMAAKPQDLEAVKAVLGRHRFQETARRRASKAVELKLRPRLTEEASAPPTKLEERRLWAEGLLSGAYRAFSSFPHPVLLDDEQLLRAVRLGQRDIFLPLVDQVHFLLCQGLEQCLGPGLWEKYEADPDKRDYILSEITPLAYFIKYNLQTVQYKYRNLLYKAEELAFKWRNLRNLIAHNNYVSYEELNKAIQCYFAFIESLSVFED